MMKEAGLALQEHRPGAKRKTVTCRKDLIDKRK